MYKSEWYKLLKTKLNDTSILKCELSTSVLKEPMIMQHGNINKQIALLELMEFINSSINKKRLFNIPLTEK